MIEERQIATEHNCNAKWGGAPPGERFRCGLCGHKFVVGEGWRFVFATGKLGIITRDGEKFGLPNLLVCDTCDGLDVLDKWHALHIEFYGPKFWALR
jgi:hypothetical protein